MKVTAHKYVALLFCILCPTWWACFKHTIQPPDNPYGLPNATQNGANIFAYRLDGSNIFTKADIYHLQGTIRNDTLFISATSPYGLAFVELDFTITPAHQLNTPFSLPDNTIGHAYFSTDTTCKSDGQYFRVPVNMGTVTITRADSIRQIISGTFSFRATVDSCSEISISDGRFDYHYF